MTSYCKNDGVYSANTKYALRVPNFKSLKI